MKRHRDKLLAMQFSHRQTEGGHQANDENAQRIDAENAPHHERTKEPGSALSLPLPFEREHQHKTGMDEKDLHADDAGKNDSQRPQVRQPEEICQMSEQNEQHGDGAQKIQVRQISAGERRPNGAVVWVEEMGSV